jgi:hypothetical protein
VYKNHKGKDMTSLVGKKQWSGTVGVGVVVFVF